MSEDNRLSIQLVCNCSPQPVVAAASHEVSLENNTGQTLFDVAFRVTVAHWSAQSRLEVSPPGTQSSFGASAGHRSGSLPSHASTKEVFTARRRGSGGGWETLETTGDWTLSANTPLTGAPPQRFSRHCPHDVNVA